jgi:hypothetical protein
MYSLILGGYMTREEFIMELRRALEEEIPASEIENNINYYNSYIRDQMQSKSEEEVLIELGDPRLIAKTIVESFQMSQGPLYNNKRQRMGYEDAYTEEWQDNDAREGNSQDNDVFGGTGSSYHVYKNYELKWYHKVALVAMIVVVLSIVIIIGGIILKLFFSIGIPLLLIYLVYRLIIANRNN